MLFKTGIAQEHKIKIDGKIPVDDLNVKFFLYLDDIKQQIKNTMTSLGRDHERKENLYILVPLSGTFSPTF